MRSIIVLSLALLLFGCASDPAKREEVARNEAARMRPTEVPLDQFNAFELAPIGMSPDVSAAQEKVAVAKDVEARLEARIRPLLDGWNRSASTTPGKPRTLVVKPTIASMHVVSTAARFWIGAMSGDSYIDLDLTLVEKETGALIANQRINRNSNAMAGAWSVGASDRNLPDYIVDIAYQYLADNHRARPVGDR
ncbi:MAG: DUF4410 domain-containing protein [Myxococcota bacterium]